MLIRLFHLFRVAWLLKLCLLVVAISASSVNGQISGSKSFKGFTTADNVSIQQAIFSDLIARKVNHGYFKASVIFVAAGPDGKHDPVHALLAAFRSHNPPVLGKSESNISTGGVVHRKDGRRGILLSVHSTKRTSTGACQAVATVFYDGKAGGAYRYRLNRTNGSWKVVSAYQSIVY